MIPTSTYHLSINFLTPLLGTQPSRDVLTEYLAKKHGLNPDPDEAALLPDLLERGTTVFHRTSEDSDDPARMNYHILGFLKEAGKVLNGKAGAGVRNLRYKVSSYVTVTPRVIPLQLPAGEILDFFERPLRADTPTGPRVLIARSEICPAGATIDCGLEVIQSDISEDVLRDLLDYGYNHGIGQWRSSGAYGTFRYTLTPEDF